MSRLTAQAQWPCGHFQQHFLVALMGKFHLHKGNGIASKLAGKMSSTAYLFSAETGADLYLGLLFRMPTWQDSSKVYQLYKSQSWFKIT